MPEAIAVKFDNGPKLHYVESSDKRPELGSKCIVDVRRGQELALVRVVGIEAEQTIGQFLRVANDEDISIYNKNLELAEELKWFLKAKAREVCESAKIISLEFNMDRSLLTVNYSSKGRVPYNQLAKEIKRFVDSRIDFVHVGPRDQTRILGTLGLCGSGACSNTWMQGFNAVSIRLARDQQLPLNPDKISGNCGRLMCSLQFEHSMYVELLKGMPRKGALACHEDGNCGLVSKIHPLKQTVEIYSNGKLLEYASSELEIKENPAPNKRRPRNNEDND